MERVVSHLSAHSSLCKNVFLRPPFVNQFLGGIEVFKEELHQTVAAEALTLRGKLRNVNDALAAA